MKRWRLHVADRNSGAKKTLILRAIDEPAAVQRAGKAGFRVEGARCIGQERVEGGFAVVTAADPEHFDFETDPIHELPPDLPPRPRPRLFLPIAAGILALLFPLAAISVSRRVDTPSPALPTFAEVMHQQQEAVLMKQLEAQAARDAETMRQRQAAARIAWRDDMMRKFGGLNLGTHIPINVGAVGYLPHGSEILQVISQTEMLIRTDEGTVLWLTNVDATKSADGQAVRSSLLFVVTGTRSYASVGGAPKTVFVLACE